MSTPHPIFDSESAFSQACLGHSTDHILTEYFEQLARLDGHEYVAHVPAPLVVQASNTMDPFEAKLEERQFGGRQQFRIQLSHYSEPFQVQDFRLFLVPKDKCEAIADIMMSIGEQEKALRLVFERDFLVKESTQRQEAFKVLSTLPQLFGTIDAEGTGQTECKIPPRTPPLNCQFMMVVISDAQWCSVQAE